MMAKKCAALLLALLLLPLPALAGEITTTILIYMCGSDLETEDRSATDDIMEMIRSGVMPGGPVILAMETGGTKEWHLRSVSNARNQRFTLDEKGLSLAQDDLGRRNMGNSNTLADFLQWGLKAYPADRTILMLWDHGAGPLEGVCYDELFDLDCLTMQELENALEKGLSGKRLDAIIFDACLMADYEVAAALTPYARYMAASQEDMPGIGLQYRDWLQALVKDPELAILDICSLMADSLVMGAEAEGEDIYATYSVIDLDEITHVTKALDLLAAAGEEALAAGMGEELLAARERVLSFGEFYDEPVPTDLVDMLNLCDALKDILPDAAENLARAVKKAVKCHRTTENFSASSRSISLYWPLHATREYPEYLQLYASLTGSAPYAAFAGKMGNLSNGKSETALYPGLWAHLMEAEDETEDETYPFLGWIAGKLMDIFFDDEESDASDTQLSHYPGLWREFGKEGPEAMEEPAYPGLWREF